MLDPTASSDASTRSFDILLEAVEARRSGRPVERRDWHKLADTVPDGELSSDHQARVAALFRKRQYGYRRTAINLGHLLQQSLHAQTARHRALLVAESNREMFGLPTDQSSQTDVVISEPEGPVLPAAFDYGALSVPLASRQRDRAERIAAIHRRTVEAAGEIGRELLAAQAELERGTFLDWIETGTCLSRSSAYRCMDIARSFGARLPSLGSLPLAVVQKLAEKSTPEPVRAAVLQRIEAGETIAPAAILHEVQEAKEAARQAAEAQAERDRVAKLTDEEREAESKTKQSRAKRKAARDAQLARERHEVAEREARQAEACDAAARMILDKMGADADAFLALAEEAGYFGGVLRRARALRSPLKDELLPGLQRVIPLGHN